MISLTCKADFYENSLYLLKSIANPLQINRMLYNANFLFRKMKLPGTTATQHLAD